MTELKYTWRFNHSRVNYPIDQVLFTWTGHYYDSNPISIGLFTNVQFELTPTSDSSPLIGYYTLDSLVKLNAVTTLAVYRVPKYSFSILGMLYMGDPPDQYAIDPVQKSLTLIRE